MKSKKQLDKEIFECYEYFEDLTDEERKWAIKFYREFYFADYYSEDETINPEKNKSEDINRHNAKTRDAMGKYNERSLQYTHTGGQPNKDHDWDWKDDFKVGGNKLATHTIIKEAVQELQNKEVDVNVTLIRFYVKMDKLRKYRRKK